MSMQKISGYRGTVTVDGRECRVTSFSVEQPQKWFARRWIDCGCCRGSGEVQRAEYRPGDYLRVDQCDACEGVGQVPVMAGLSLVQGAIGAFAKLTVAMKEVSEIFRSFGLPASLLAEQQRDQAPDRNPGPRS
jgi:hypothetical protein